jgi:hypothetical protein
MVFVVIVVFVVRVFVVGVVLLVIAVAVLAVMVGAGWCESRRTQRRTSRNARGGPSSGSATNRGKFNGTGDLVAPTSFLPKERLTWHNR